MYEEGLAISDLAKKGERRIPFSCHMDLTYQCNLKCIHCYVQKQDRSELDTDQVKDILKQLAQVGTLYLHLSGGEILLREDFFEIAEYARKLHFAVDLSTNGTLLNEEIAEKISSLSPGKVKISIFSNRSEIHDRITGVSGSLKKSINAVKLLKNRGIVVHVVDILMNQNIQDYPAVYELSQSLGVDFKVDHRMTPRIDGNRLPLNYQISDKDFFRILTDPIFHPKENQDKKILPPKSSFYDDVACDAAQSFFYISPYGDVFPCVQFPLLCGSLLNQSFQEIWENSSKMLYASKLRISNIKECSKCQLGEYCSFCPGLAFSEGGNMMSPYERACNEAYISFKANLEINK